MQEIENQFQPEDLNGLMDRLSGSGSSCVLHVNAKVGAQGDLRSRVLIWQDGKLVCGGLSVPDARDFAKSLIKRANPKWTDSTLKTLSKKVANGLSMQSLLNLLFRLRVLNWTQLQDFMRERIILTLEQLIDREVQIDIAPPSSMILFRIKYDGGNAFKGFDINELRLALSDRQSQWRALLPTVPSIEAIPFLATSLANIADDKVRQHIEKWIDGKRSLVDLAVQFDRDPLELAQAYCNWTQNGWIEFTNLEVSEVKQLPAILAVDDSPIIQTMIKRALSSQYEVLQAGGALESLNILNQQGDRISLLILDLTMPDIDGLQLCRTIRSIPKFKELPIIMLTARDGFFDKIKGQMAGSDRYLTKPFEAEKLLEIVQEYV
jgi:CheY-like chemotaxis protein